MNAKQRLAAAHKRELRYAKDALTDAVNRQIQSFKKQGFNAEVTPQILTMLKTRQYRKRDVEKINSLVANPEKLKGYILASDSVTGEVVSGEQAIERYNRYATSNIRKPAKQLEVMTDNFIDTVQDTFVDLSVLNDFLSFLSDLTSNPLSVIDESMLQALHPNWFSSEYRGNVNYGINSMLLTNSAEIAEMKSAVQRLISVEGEQEVARRISDNYEELQDAAIQVAIGYKDVAGSALQTVLNVFLPKSIKNYAMLRTGMSSMEDLIESQFEDFYEE